MEINCFTVGPEILVDDIENWRNIYSHCYNQFSLKYGCVKIRRNNCKLSFLISFFYKCHNCFFEVTLNQSFITNELNKQHKFPVKKRLLSF